MLQVFNSTARYVDQVEENAMDHLLYLEPWHSDIKEWLDLKKNHGDEALRAKISSTVYGFEWVRVGC